MHLAAEAQLGVPDVLLETVTGPRALELKAQLPEQGGGSGVAFEAPAFDPVGVAAFDGVGAEELTQARSHTASPRAAHELKTDLISMRTGLDGNDGTLALLDKNIRNMAWRNSHEY